MAMLTVRNLPEEVHRAHPQGRVNFGSLLADMGREANLSDEESALFEQVRDKAPVQPLNFERSCSPPT
jgi:plasmid stability protein